MRKTPPKAKTKDNKDKPKPANKSRNPNIVEAGKKTQFKKGHVPATAAPDADIKPWSYRKELKYLAAQPIDCNPEMISAEMKRLMKMPNGLQTTPARMAAARAIERVITRMEPALFEKLIDNTEGKLSQEITMPDFAPAPTKYVTVEEAAEAYKKYMGR